MRLEKQDLLNHVAKTDTAYDVVVCGSGPAGIGAALAAGMNGARTLILEGRSQFGGTATAALWMKINWLFADDQETSRGGVHQLLVDKIRGFGPAASRPGHREKPSGVGGGNIDAHPLYLKKALFELFEEHEVDYMLYAPVTGVTKEDDRVTGVKVTGKEGVITFPARVVVDATGDGDALYHAGCEMTEGREEDRQHMPITVVFALANVDVEALWMYCFGAPSESGHGEGARSEEFTRALDDARDKGKYHITTWYNLDQTTIPGVVSVNNGGSGYFNLDGTKSGDLTAMERLGVEIATDFLEFLKEYDFPGVKDAHVLRTGAYAAVRDTRRLVGAYVVTEEDMMSGKQFEDVIATKYGGVDAVGFKTHIRISQGAQWPYRSLLPKRIDGILAAGRCGSASFLGHSSGKSMGNMMSLGQGAGIAASICARKEIQPRQLDAKEVQTVLKSWGAR